MTADERPPVNGDHSDEQRARADAAIRAIAHGADPAAEALRLSNEFTDDATARWSAALRRRFSRKTRS